MRCSTGRSTAPALIRRLAGILAARDDVRQTAAAADMSSILERAIANEEAAAAFYRRAAQGVSNPDTRKVLESLMRDEEEHKRIIEEFRSGAGRCQRARRNRRPWWKLSARRRSAREYPLPMPSCWRRTRNGWPWNSTRTGPTCIQKASSANCCCTCPRSNGTTKPGLRPCSPMPPFRKCGEDYGWLVI